MYVSGRIHVKSEHAYLAVSHTTGYRNIKDVFFQLLSQRSQLPGDG
jgi:hypothetical protein